MVLEQIVIDWVHLAILAMAVGFLLHEVGMLSLGHSGLVLTGAYCTALFVLHKLSLPAALGIALLLLALMSLTALKVKEDIFAVVTLAIAEMMRLLTVGAAGYTGGTLGLGPIPRHAWIASSTGSQFFATGTLLVSAAIAAGVLKYWPGLILGSVRDGELLAQGFGLRTRLIRTLAVVASGCAALLVGVLQVQYYGLASPRMGSLDVSLQALAAAMIAWPLWQQGRPARALVGFIGGSFLLVLIPPILRLVLSEGADVATIRQGMFGLLLYVLVHPKLALSKKMEAR